MPIYDQECLACGHVSEEFYKDSEQPIVCPLCKGKARKLIVADTIAAVVDGEIYNEQLNRRFKNRSEKDTYLRSRGLREVGQEEGKRIGLVLRDKAEAEARKYGYRDLEQMNGRKQ